MTETYVAPTNGHEITATEEGWLYVSRPGMEHVTGHEATKLVKGRVQSLREFFRDERDKELGRWRDPKYPNYPAYPLSNGGVRVLEEFTGQSQTFTPETAKTSNEWGTAIARAYFDAHPVKKPWHDAKPGEVWELQWNSTLTTHSQPALVRNDGKFALRDSDGTEEGNELTDERIVDAKRIYPAN